MIEIITSKDSKTLKFAQSLQKKKYRTLHQAYLAEGLRTVVDMMPTGYVQSVLMTDVFRDSEDGEAVVKEAEGRSISVYVMNQTLFKQVEKTVHGQGIVGIVKKQSLSMDDVVKDFTEKPEKAIYALLDEVQDPGNLGTIIRTALAAGVKAIFLTKGSVDPYNEKTVRSTMSAITKLPIIEDVDLETMRALKSQLGLTFYGTALEEATSLYKTNFTYPAVFLLGNEARGLSAEWLQMADKRVHIPMYGPIESLNLNVAAALCFYAARECDDCE
ncbi:RNA methyltransferase [Veillonella sp.]|uniref:TrmH family RNA methyltransferase n=1 Tax=Veillonella sp. TaxID=1926307 RepID=UPI0025EF4D2F|nr:RNA methyltransferase [Veillonella sp.]